MINRFRTPLAIALASALSISLFVGCSSDDKKDSADSTTTTAASSDSGSGASAADDSAGDSASSTDADFDICTTAGVNETTVGLILSATVTKEDVPGGGCDFSQDDPRAPSISFYTVAADADGAFESAQSGAFAVMTDPTITDPTIGARSVIGTGTALGGSSQAAVGIMQDRSSIVTVTVRGQGLDASSAEAMANSALSLAEQNI